MKANNADIEKQEAKGHQGRGRRRFEDLSQMTRELVIDIAKRMECTREEIVEGLNQ